MITHTSLITDDIIAPELVAGQSIIVYQTDTGRQLLRVDAAPVARAGQNFSLAPDGLSLAVIRNNAVEIYPLPPLSGKDREAVQRAAATAPQLTGSPSGRFSPEAIGDAAAPSSPPSTPSRPNVPIYNTAPAPAPWPPPASSSSKSQSPSQPAKAEDPPAPQQSEQNSAGAEEQTRRKPPTLYNESGEHPGTNSQQPK
jgi:hypothetical protein